METEKDKTLAEIVCQAWNTLNTEALGPVLSDDFEYISFWVLETMKGKTTYLDYIKRKFSAIQNGDKPVSAKVLFQKQIGKFIVVLDQCGNDAALELTIEDDKIKSMWMRPVSLTLPAVFTTRKPK